MYKVIGADHVEYGPVTAGQLGEWIAEGRANAASLVWAEGAVDWRPLAAIPEFAAALKSATMPPQVIGPTISPRSRGNGMAVAGMVMGILAVVLFWLPFVDQLFAVLGLIFALIGWSRAKRNSMQGTGRGAAITGIILSVLGLFMGVAVLLLFGTIVAMNSN